MDLQTKVIDVAAGRQPADCVIKNCNIIDVYTAEIVQGDIALVGGIIAGIGDYEGKTVVDGTGKYAAPGFIDGHIHIESAFVTPEEIGRLLVPHGATTIVADPHEIANVCGVAGVQYMMDAATHTKLDIRFMVPSCVPSTPFEHAGATLEAEQIAQLLADARTLGLGEMMNFPAVMGADAAVLAKLQAAHDCGKPIDGHAPLLSEKGMNAYAAGRILTNHECVTVAEMHACMRSGLYVQLRDGSACHNLRTLLGGVTAENSCRCLLCSDDRQPKTILEQGHLDNHLRICVQEGLPAVTAIRMATLNAATCYGMADRGAIAPGLRADIVLLDDLTDFGVHKVWIAGELVAEQGAYLPITTRHDHSAMASSFTVRNFSAERLNPHLTPSPSGTQVHVIGIVPEGIVTQKLQQTVMVNAQGNFVHNPAQDIAKIAVVERHQGTGNVAVALLQGYGIQHGAIAISIAHDSHNIIAVGVDDADMVLAVQQLIAQNGGVVLAKDGAILQTMPLPIGGIMSDQSGAWVDAKITAIHQTAHEALGVSRAVEPIMTLAFMSLPVIPALKLTDMGLFDVEKFAFVPLEVDA